MVIRRRDDEGWLPDVLGEGFASRVLELPPDDEGPAIATLVRSLPRRRLLPWRRGPLHDVDVLYVHGWSDYFFQRSLARFWTSRAARFFALDLRGYGRSLRAGRAPGHITDLDSYDDDIAAALAAMGDRTGRRLVLFGHSTGGLVLSLWAHRHPDEAAAVILNSPWLEFQLSSAARAALAPVVDLRARTRPLGRIPQFDLGFYARAQAETEDPADPSDIDLAWRPVPAFAPTAGFLDAVLDGHARVARGLAIPAPICVLLSSRSEAPTRWSDVLTRVDSVLNVDLVARSALRLGPSVSIERIDGAIHDVLLSRPAARAEAYARLARWVDGFVGG